MTRTIAVAFLLIALAGCGPVRQGAAGAASAIAAVENQEKVYLTTSPRLQMAPPYTRALMLKKGPGQYEVHLYLHHWPHPMPNYYAAGSTAKSKAEADPPPPRGSF